MHPRCHVWPSIKGEKFWALETKFCPLPHSRHLVDKDPPLFHSTRICTMMLQNATKIMENVHISNMKILARDNLQCPQVYLGSLVPCFSRSSAVGASSCRPTSHSTVSLKYFLLPSIPLYPSFPAHKGSKGVSEGGRSLETS